MARWYSRGFAPCEVAFDASLVNFIHWNIISWLATGTQRCEAINVLLHRGCIVLPISISVLIFESCSILLRIFQKCCNSPLFLSFHLKIRTTTDVILQIFPNKSSGSFVPCVNWIFAMACRRDTPTRAENVGNIDLQKRLTAALTALTATNFECIWTHGPLLLTTGIFLCALVKKNNKLMAISWTFKSAIFLIMFLVYNYAEWSKKNVTSQ